MKRHLLLFASALVLLASCKKDDVIKTPYVPDYSYKIAGRWYETYRTVVEYDGTEIRNADTVESEKGREIQDYNGSIVSYYSSGKLIDERNFDFKDGVNLTVTKNGSSVVEKYLVSMSGSKAHLKMTRETTNGIKTFIEETNIDIER